jgi:hypothetical protein
VPATSTPQKFGLTTAYTYCSVNQSQALVCTLGVDAPVGQDVFLAQTYDVNGNLTGSGAVALSVALNSTNAAAITLSAQVANVFVVPGSTYLGDYYSQQLGSKARTHGAQSVRRTAQGSNLTLSSIPIYVIASDSTNTTILNPSNYSSPIYLQLAFDWYYWNMYTADVTLQVTYGASDTSPCAAGATATASDWYQSIMLCSPSDQVTASLPASGGANPSDYAYVFGWVTASSLVPTPAPNMTPLPLPTPPSNTYAQFYVYPTPTPSPSPSPTPVPTPTGPTAPITVIGQ